MSDMQTTPIAIPFPEATDLQLKITVGACRLHIHPGNNDDFVNGVYKAPDGALPVRTVTVGGAVRIEQERNVSGITGLVKGIPEFHLGLGKGRPFSLKIETGASENDVDLGGISVTDLVINQGAGKTDLHFSTANPFGMNRMEIGAGAGAIELSRLANANAAEISIGGGAASFVTDFGGYLRRDSTVKISAGMSAVDVRIPSSTAARVTSDSFLGRVDVGDGFTKDKGAYCTAPALNRTSPILTINANVALGLLSLRLTEEISLPSPEASPAMA